MIYKDSQLYLIRNEQVQKATLEGYRQYFCGNLQRPQSLDFVQTESLEVGTSHYAIFTYDTPHLHTFTPDMIYILEGQYHIKLLRTGQIFILEKGDFISIPANEPYASKAKAKTTTLFIKQTAVNDKVNVQITAEDEIWLKAEI